MPPSLRLISPSMIRAAIHRGIYSAVVVVTLRYAVGIVPTVAGAIGTHAGVHVDVPRGLPSVSCSTMMDC